VCAGDGKMNGAETGIDRDSEGRARYSWKSGAARLHPDRIRDLISAGRLKLRKAGFNFMTLKRAHPSRRDAVPFVGTSFGSGG